MAKDIRVRVGRGVLELLENIDLPEDTEMIITLLDVPSNEDREVFRRAAGRWKGHVDAETLISSLAPQHSDTT